MVHGLKKVEVEPSATRPLCHTERQTGKQAGRKTASQPARETARQRDTHRHRDSQRDSLIANQRDSLTASQTDRKSDGRRDGQPARHQDREGHCHFATQRQQPERQTENGIACVYDNHLLCTLLIILLCTVV